MAEETPHTGIGVAYILEVDGTIGITEGEVLVLAFIKAPLFRKTDDIGGIDAFHLRAVDLLEVLATDAGVFAFLFQRELPNAAKVGMGADAIIRDT